MTLEILIQLMVDQLDRLAKKEAIKWHFSRIKLKEEKRWKTKEP